MLSRLRQFFVEVIIILITFTIYIFIGIIVIAHHCETKRSILFIDMKKRDHHET